MLIIYHGQCSDGHAAAWVARKVFPKAEFIPVSYGESPPDVEGQDVYIFDFSYKRSVAIEMHGKAKSFRIIDHHRTAAKELGDLPFCKFDMSKSGATLAWETFKDRIGGEMPWLVSYTEDRDLAKYSLPFSLEINAAVASYPFDFEVWDELEKKYPDVVNSSLVNDGRSILRFQDRLIDSVIEKATPVELDGYRVMAANTSVVHGEVAMKLAMDNPFGVSWYKREGKFIHSLRSRSEVDVSEIAHSHGGGGHYNAAGFESKQMVMIEL